MTASNAKGVKICMMLPTPTPTAMAFTAATKAAPVVVTVADVTGLAEGDIITLKSDTTGLPEIDGKTFTIQNIDGTANTFELAGSDASGSTGTFAAGTAADIFGSDDLQCLCLSEFTFNLGTPDTISTGTFCDPSASIAGVVAEAGTADFAGYIKTDPTTDDGKSYRALRKWEELGGSRTFRILLPLNGAVLFDGTLASLGIAIPLNGALSYQGSITLGSRPRHLF